MYQICIGFYDHQDGTETCTDAENLDVSNDKCVQMCLYFLSVLQSLSPKVGSYLILLFVVCIFILATDLGLQVYR